MTAQPQNSPTEWEIHVHEARKAGLDEPIIEALENGERPSIARDGSDDRLAAILQFSEELLAGSSVGDETYDAAVSLLGERGVVELTSIIGYYTYVAMTLNVFDIKP